MHNISILCYNSGRTKFDAPGQWISNLDNIRAVDKDPKESFTCLSIQSIIIFLKHMELNWLQGEILEIMNIPEYLIRKI